MTIPGTEGYTEQAAGLVKRYEPIPFADKHQSILHLFPDTPCRVLDIGAGTGADAAWFASKGHSVVAVEPTAELRKAAMAHHPSSSIAWVNDSLPGLASLLASGHRFNLVMLTAVWMHLDESERRLAMPNLASLLAPNSVLIMSLRHGPAPGGRRMFEVSGEETISLAKRSGLRLVLNVRTASAQASNRAAGVTWTRLAFK